MADTPLLGEISLSIVFESMEKRVQENGDMHIRGLITLLCGGLIILVNLSIGAILCSLTIYHLQTEKNFSHNYKDYQFKILRALFAQVLVTAALSDEFSVFRFFWKGLLQSAIPILVMYCPTGVGIVRPLFFTTEDRKLDPWFTLISSFPALDAIVIITLLKDYRQGVISIVFRRKRTQLELSSWKTPKSGWPQWIFW